MAFTAAGRSDAQANRARLVEAARALFREHGLGVDVKEIAERAEVGIGTVYRNFASKEDLIRAVVDQIAAEARNNILAICTIEDPGERLATLIEVGFSLAEREGPLLQILHEAHDAPPAEVQELILRVFQDAQRSGAIRADLPLEMFLAFMKHQFALFLELRDAFPPGQARDAIQALIFGALQLEPVGPRRDASSAAAS